MKSKKITPYRPPPAVLLAKDNYRCASHNKCFYAQHTSLQLRYSNENGVCFVLTGSGTADWRFMRVMNSF